MFWECQPTTTIIQAEDGTIAGFTIENAHANYNGTGYIDHLGNNNTAEYIFQSPSAGPAQLTLRYANSNKNWHFFQMYKNQPFVVKIALFSKNVQNRAHVYEFLSKKYAVCHSTFLYYISIFSFIIFTHPGRMYP